MRVSYIPFHFKLFKIKKNHVLFLFFYIFNDKKNNSTISKLLKIKKMNVLFFISKMIKKKNNSTF